MLTHRCIHILDEFVHVLEPHFGVAVHEVGAHRPHDVVGLVVGSLLARVRVCGGVVKGEI